MKALQRCLCIDMNKKIGIMGGTFDPPHIGHLAMAECVREALELSEIWFIPTGKIPHKDSAHAASPADRFNMVAAAIRENPYFSVKDIEVKRKDYSYTFETLEVLKEKYPDAELTFIVGADSLDYMEQWRKPERIFKCCRIAAVNRQGISMEQLTWKKKMLAECFDARIDIVSMPVIGISSTDLRERIKNGKSVSYFVPDNVIEYIKQNSIYKN